MVCAPPPPGPPAVGPRLEVDIAKGTLQAMEEAQPGETGPKGERLADQAKKACAELLRLAQV